MLISKLESIQSKEYKDRKRKNVETERVEETRLRNTSFCPFVYHHSGLTPTHPHFSATPTIFLPRTTPVKINGWIPIFEKRRNEEKKKKFHFTKIILYKTYNLSNALTSFLLFGF